jgi:hypothetical protein
MVCSGGRVGVKSIKTDCPCHIVVDYPPPPTGTPVTIHYLPYHNHPLDSMGKGQRLNPQTAAVVKECLRSGHSRSIVLMALNQHAADNNYAAGSLPCMVPTSESIRGFYERMLMSRRASANDFENVLALRDVLGHDTIHVFRGSSKGGAEFRC